MLRKSLLALPILLFLATPPLLAQEQAAGNAPEQESVRTYVVQKGDTLWDISQKFIEDPYYWPDLWANNPDILNPHLITPGQKLRIYAGPIMVVSVEPPPPPAEPVTEPVAEPVVETPPPPPVAAEPQVLVTVPAGAGYISAEALAGTGTIYDYPEGRKLAATGDTVFVRMQPQIKAEVGERYDIFMTKEEIFHPVSKRRIGYEIDRLGTLEITALGKDLQTAVIRKTFREIERGAWLVPQRPTRQEIALRRADVDVSGYILSSASHRTIRARNELVFIDLGEKHGLKTGNLLTITRPRQATEEVKADSRTKAEVTFPDELVGFALVVDTKEDSATAVLLKALSPALIGDRVRTQTGEFTR